MNERIDQVHEDIEELIGHIYEASYRPEHWHTVLQLIAQLTGSRSALMMYQDNTVRRATTTWVYNLTQHAIDTFNNANTPDPTISLVASNVPLGVATANHLLIPDRQQLEEYYGDFYHDLLLPFDMYYVGGVILFNDESKALAIGLHRSQEDGPWRPAELDRLSRLSSHIQRALNIHREFTGLKNREIAMNIAFDRMIMGIMLVDEFFSCTYLNATASQIVDQNDIIRIEDNKIQLIDPLDHNRFQAALVKALSADAQLNPEHFSTAVGAWNASRQQKFPMLVSPASGVGLGFDPANMRSQVIVLINDPNQVQPFYYDALQKQWGLTPAESKIAVAIVNGHTLSKVAAANDVSLSTVKTHLQSIYRKMAITRQADLVRLLLTSPYHLQW